MNGEHIFQQISQRLGESQASQILVLTDDTIAKIMSFPYPTLILPAGDGNKNLSSIERIWDFLHEQQATRQTMLLCIGGGVITDMGGFAAGTYKRGIRYINIPTTLLAMIDAGTGGKTGFNHHGIKNEIGCFYPPEDTLIFVDFLDTLPTREFLSGYAEMIKHALIADLKEWHKLLQFPLEDYWKEIDQQASTRPYHDELEIRIKASLSIKHAISQADPKDLSIRKTLNFGHTIGHALEAIAIEKNYNLPHGYAVMQGMVAETYLSVVCMGLDKEVLRILTHQMIERYGKVGYTCQDYQQLIERMRHDKKNTDSQHINFTLLQAVGKAQWDKQIDEKLIVEALEYLFTL